MEQIEKFLKDIGLRFRKNERDYQLNCPLCGDNKYRLGIKIEKVEEKNKDHQWNCFRCNQKGSSLRSLKYAIDKLNGLERKEFIEFKDNEKVKIKPDFHIEFHKKLGKTRKAAEYLINERKLTKECIVHFKLGFRDEFQSTDDDLDSLTEENKQPYIAIPYLEHGKCVNIKYRYIGDKEDVTKWRREKGGKTSLFNYDVCFDNDYTTLLISESEIDAMSLWCRGYKNVVGLTGGAKTFKQEWYDVTQRFEKIYIVLDNDEAGQIGAKLLAKRLGLNRCYNVLLPSDTKDPNDFFKKYDNDYFDDLLSKATQFDVERVQSLRQLIKQEVIKLDAPDEVLTSFETDWKRLNFVLGTLDYGSMIVVAARSKIGKTSVVHNLSVQLAHRYNAKIFEFQCEMTEKDLSNAYSQIITGESVKLSAHDKSHLKIFYRRAINDKVTSNIFTFHPTLKDLTLEKIEEKIRESVQRFGIDVVIFDNLLFVCRGENTTAMVDKTSQLFKSLAIELDVVFVVITHPRKVTHDRELDNFDLKDSTSLFQDCDKVILLHRPQIQEKLDTDEDDMNDDDYDSLFPTADKKVKESNIVQESMFSPITHIKVTDRRGGGGRTKLVFRSDIGVFIDDGPYFEKCIEEERNRINKKVKDGTKKS